jgi:cation transport regulator ChaC
MSALLYFAYGSNMYAARLRYRAPSCRFLFTARLLRHLLCFHKRSSDGSGKCNAFATAASKDSVFGVVYEISPAEKPALDRAEGLGSGYHDERLRVRTPNGQEVQVQTYIADRDAIDDKLKPYSWYKDFVVKGAHEHGLPSEYIHSYIESVLAVTDPDRKRDESRRMEAKF